MSGSDGNCVREDGERAREVVRDCVRETASEHATQAIRGLSTHINQALTAVSVYEYVHMYLCTM